MAVCRLQSLALFVREWNGPVTVTMYIEFRPGTKPAAACKAAIIDWFQRAYTRLWPEEGTEPPLSVSLMYTVFPLTNTTCDIPTSLPLRRQDDRVRTLSVAHDDQEILEESARVGDVAGLRGDVEAGSRRETRDANGGVLWQPGRSWGGNRRLQAPEDYSLITDPGGGAAASDVWHYWPNRWWHRMRGPEGPWQDEYDRYHPVNALRNIAWSQV